jgi:hypothetical protein
MDSFLTYFGWLVVLFIVGGWAVILLWPKGGSAGGSTDNHSILPYSTTGHSGDTGGGYASGDSADVNSSGFGGGGDFGGGGSGGDFGGGDSGGGDSGGGDGGGGE